MKQAIAGRGNLIRARSIYPSVSIRFATDYFYIILLCLFCLGVPNHLIAQEDKRVITTLVGSGPVGPNQGSFSGDGGPATKANLNSPFNVAVDAKGIIYISDGGQRIRRVGPDSIISTLAGSGSRNFSGDGGPATQAGLYAAGIAVDTKGFVYIADATNNRIRRVSSDGIITTFAGTGTANFSGDGGAATKATLNTPIGVAIDAQGIVYIADLNNQRIRRIGLDGIITTLAGSGNKGFSGDGGSAIQASLSNPGGVAVDSKGFVYIADSGNNRVRRVGPDGIIATIAGSGSRSFSGDGGLATQAGLYPVGVAVDVQGVVYIADSVNHYIRRVGLDGIITTFAGTGTASFSGDGGIATKATLNGPTGVAVDAQGVVYIADFNNHRIRRVAVVGDNFWINIGLMDYVVNTLVIDPSNSQIIYAGTSEGIFRSINGGNSWATAGLSGRLVQSFAIDPSSPKTIYAGTETKYDGNGADVFKSTDGGNSWKTAGLVVKADAFSALAIDPSNSQVVYIGISDPGKGVFKTENGGFSWKEINTGLTEQEVLAFAIDPSNPQIIYAGIGLSGLLPLGYPWSGGVFKSSNSGNSWTNIWPGNTFALEIAPSNNQKIYVGSGAGVSKSIDGGNSWTKTGLTKRVLALAIDPSNSQTIYVAGNGVSMSVNGGDAWTDINSGLIYHVASLGIDSRTTNTLAIDPSNSKRIYAGTGGGVFTITLTPAILTPAISISSDSLSFRNVNIGSSATRILSIKNTGKGNLSITNISSSDRQFTVSPVSFTLPEGAIQDVTVIFTPNSEGTKSASLSITHNATASPLTVVLSGTGIAVSEPPISLTPKVGDGTGGVGVGDQKAKTLGGVKPGQKIDISVVCNQEITGATGFQVVLTFDPKKLMVASGKKDGIFVSAVDLPPQTTDNTVTYGGAFLGQSMTVKGSVAVLTFQALSDFSGDTEVTLTSLSIKITGGSKDFKPGASVVISSRTIAGGIPSPDFDGNGVVNFDDFFLFATAFGMKQSDTGFDNKFDLNSDGVIDFSDFFAFAEAFGKKI